MKQPLSEILRPKTLDEYVGQTHLMGEGAILRVAIEMGHIHSMILWGPPGVGKTTLALLVAEVTHARFFMLSAINSGVKEIREVFDKAEKLEQKVILFIDEIHRFSKSQQDSLLGAVERGVVTLIGATTENPSFEVISPLLSRCQVYVLKSLEKKDLECIIHNTCRYLEKETGTTIVVDESEALLRLSGGDARKLINAIEVVVSILPPDSNGVLHFTNEVVLKVIQKNLVIYDKKGENHYDIISAFIKSMRGSDPNAAVYYLARMLAAGEDPLFIARRMIILASEDIGNANPNALLLANACFQSVHQIGMPEARIILSQTATYLAASPKSNASYMAIEEAMNWVTKTGDLPVPLHIRNAPTQLMKDLGYHKGYQYAHQYENNFSEQEYLPDSIRGLKLYDPGNSPRENELRRYLRACWKEKYHYILFLLLSLTGFITLQGQDWHYSQFQVSEATLNPAHTGMFDGIVRGGLQERTQWLSVGKPFQTITGTVDLPVYKHAGKQWLVGTGISITDDNAGDTRYHSFQVQGSVGITKGLDRYHHHRISAGAYVAWLHRSLNRDALSFDEQYVNGYFSPDNPISETIERVSFGFLDWGIGMAWTYRINSKHNLVLGTTLSHLNRPEQSLLNVTSLLPVKSLSYIFAKITVSDYCQLQPAMYTAFQSRYFTLVAGSNVEFIFKKNNYQNGISVGTGLFYRYRDALVVTFLTEWENLRLVCSYDINISKFDIATRYRGGFELSLFYTLKRKKTGRAGYEPCSYGIL